MAVAMLTIPVVDELVGATVIGYLVFADIPGPSTVIVAGGLLLVRR